MTIYKSGRRFVALHALLWVVAIALFWALCGSAAVNIVVTAVGVYMSFFVATFFRIPDREMTAGAGDVISPADGTVVNIEEVHEGEFLHKRCIRVSIFMTFFNVHVNWYPVSGVVRYFKYHPGDKFIAMHAKSSDKNERTSIVVTTDSGTDILFRQIAGLVARRIECNAGEGERCAQGNIVGMIKFGSRVDVFLPLNAQVLVKKGDLVRGRITTLARLK